MHEDREPTEREPAAVQNRKVDAVEPLKIGLYGVGGLAEDGGERRQFPEIPSPLRIASTNGPRSETFGLVALNAA